MTSLGEPYGWYAVTGEPVVEELIVMPSITRPAAAALKM
jgi:hypothetical protein